MFDKIQRAAYNNTPIIKYRSKENKSPKEIKYILGEKRKQYENGNFTFAKSCSRHLEIPGNTFSGVLDVMKYLLTTTHNVSKQ